MEGKALQGTRHSKEQRHRRLKSPGGRGSRENKVAGGGVGEGRLEDTDGERTPPGGARSTDYKVGDLKFILGFSYKSLFFRLVHH